MNSKPVITIIGAASTTFGPRILRDVLNHPQIHGADLRFVDINEGRLEVYTQLAKRLNSFRQLDLSITASNDRKTVLTGSDYVIISVDTGHYNTWRQDFEIPVQHGIRQIYGELGGPGGLFHSLRQIPLHLDIAKDIELLCPKAMVMVTSNPLNRICLALERYSNVGQVVGLCHGVEMALYLYLNNVLGIEGDDLDAVAAGTNHFTWILNLRQKSTGKDLLPQMKEKLLAIKEDKQGLSRKLLEVYGYFPATLDSHVGEYISFAYEFGMRGLDFDAYLNEEVNRWNYLKHLASSDEAWESYDKKYGNQSALSEELRIDDFFAPKNWADTLAIPIINAIHTHERHYMPAINLVNDGTISNLPADVFVEAPAVVDGNGIQPVRIGELPKPLASFIRRDIDQMELIVEAAVTGNRNLVLQAMLLDPVVDHVGNAERVLDHMLRANEPYLPQFTS